MSWMYLIVPIYFVLVIVTVAITTVKYGRVLLPNTIYTLLWGIIGTLGIINNLDLLEPSTRIHAYIIISIVSFNIVYFLFSPTKKNNGKRAIIENEITYRIDYRIIYAFAFLALLLLSIHTLEAFRIFFSSGYNMTLIRDVNNYNVENSGIMFFGFLTRSVPLGITTAISLISAVNLNLRNKKLFFCAAILIAVYTFTFGGRFQLLNFIIFYVATYLILKNKIKIKLKKRYVLVAILLLVLMTVLRGAELSLLYDKIIIYFVGSLSFLELIISNPILFGIGERPMIGYLTFGFILEPIVLAMKLFLGTDIDVPSYYFNIYAQKFYNIGSLNVQLYNNNTTMFYNFLYDFGEIGVVIGPIIICLLICLSEKKYNRDNNLKSFLFLVFLYSVIVNSPMMYTMTNVNSSLILLFLMIFVRKSRVSEKKVKLGELYGSN